MKIRLLLSSLALLFAFSILGISLFSTPRAILANGETATKSKLYFNQEILPDHVLYPALMAVDRLQLETATDSERVYVEIDYANNRLAAAKALLEKNDPALAVTTITKAEKYLQHAANEVKKQQAPPNTRQHLLDAIQYHAMEIKELESQFTDAQRAVVDQLVEENTVIAQSL
jgi:predicted nucleic acid-binding protein